MLAVGTVHPAAGTSSVVGRFEPLQGGGVNGRPFAGSATNQDPPVSVTPIETLSDGVAAHPVRDRRAGDRARRAFVRSLSSG